MAFTGTSLLSLPIITTGTESGAWGNITNNGLTQYLDTSIAGALPITSSITLANTSGDASGTNLASTTAQYRTLVVPASGPSANIVITAPSSNRTYHVVNRNATYTVQIRAGANSGVTLGVNQSATVTYNSTSADYELVGVVGASTATDNAVARFDGTTGEIIQNSGATIDDSGNLGLGVTPSFVSGYSGIQINGGGNGSVLHLTNSTTGTSSTDGFDLIVSQGGSDAYVWQRENAALLFGTNSSERARIDSNGRVLIATTTAYSDAAIGNPILQWTTLVGVRGGAVSRADSTSTATHLAFVNPNGLVGNITSTGTTTSYGTSSDYRLKHDIAPMTGALAKVAQLKPVTYKWNTDGSDGQGFIAHELQEVAPYAVTGEKDGEQMQGVDYGKLTPILTAALQEAIAKIETLEARIAVLEAK